MKGRGVKALLGILRAISSDGVLSRISLFHGAETWTTNTKSLTCMGKILSQSLKRTLQAPMSTISFALYMDTGILPTGYQIHKKALSYWWKTQNSGDSISPRLY